MKKYNYFILSLAAVLFSFSACNNFQEPPYPPELPTLIFNETFGNPTVTTPIAGYVGFVTTGIGAGSVSFVAEGSADIRSTSPSNYLGASGGGNVFFAERDGGTLLINNIAVCGARNLVLSFGTNQTSAIISVAYRINGTAEWVEIPFEKVLSGWDWVSNMNINLPEGTNTINLKFKALPVGFGVRIDDIRITTTDETGEPVIDPDDVKEPGGVIYRETFGTPTATTLIANYTGWITTGIGARAVTYLAGAGGQVDVRSTSPSNFPDASGSGNVMFSARDGGILYVNDIATCGAQNLMLSFGANQTNDTISVAYRIYGTDNWVDIPFEKTTRTWGLVDNLEITLPEGTNTIRLRFTAGTTQFGARIDDIQITTDDETGAPIIDPDDEVAPTLNVSPSSLSFEAAGGSRTLTVISNREWYVGWNNPTNFDVAVNGNIITVTASANIDASSRTATITIETYDNQVKRTVDVTQDGQGSDDVIIFNETFGNPVQTGNQWPLIADYTGFVTTGIGAGNVTYSSEGGAVSVRTTSPSSNYSTASGSGNAMFAAASGATLFVNDIAVCSTQNLVLSFGTNVTSAILTVAYRINGTGDWIAIPYTKTNDAWGLVEDLNITLPAGTNSISLRFTAGTTQYGARIDDIKIVTSDETAGC